MYRKITEDTKTEDLLALESAGKSAKPFLCELAQVVFRKESGGKLVNRRILHAFGQFSSEQLARIIDAKRKGIFDYGELIIEVPGGFRYPKPADALIMLEDAEGGHQTPVKRTPEEAQSEPSPPTQTGDSMDYAERKAELEAMNKRPLQQLHLQVTGNRSKRGEDRSSLEGRILDAEFGDNGEDAAIVEAILNAPTVEEAVKAAEATVVDLEQVARDRAESAPTEYTEEVDAVRLDQAEYALNDLPPRLIAGLRGIFVLVDILRRNQDVLANFLLENGVQNRDWSKVPEGIVQDFDILVGGSPPAAAPEPIEEEPPFVEEVQEVAEEEPPSNGSPKEGITVLSEDELRDLALVDLQDYAASIGVENPKQAFAPLLRRHVLKRLEQIT